MKKQIFWITETGVMLALLITLQAVTKPAGQYVTGSCVNMILAVSAITGGLWCGVTVALLSPFFAFLLGIGPQLLPIVPTIAVGNLVFVLLLRFMAGQGELTTVRRCAGWLAAAVCKALALYLLVVQLLCRVLPLPEPQIAVFTAMFSWPQLATALIGGGLALLAAPVLSKAVRRQAA